MSDKRKGSMDTYFRTIDLGGVNAEAKRAGFRIAGVGNRGNV